MKAVSMSVQTAERSTPGKTTKIKKATISVKPGDGWFIVELGSKPGESKVVSQFFKYSFEAYDWSIENGYDTEWWASGEQKRRNTDYRERRRKFVKMQDLPLFAEKDE